MTNKPEPNTRPLPQPSELVERLERIERDFQLPPSIQSMQNINAMDAASDAITYITQLEAQLAKLQADGDKLAGYAEHDSDCRSNVWSGGSDLNPCTCGLTQALTEWKDRA